MATWYVAGTGNDSSGNGSSGSPYRTLTKAYSVMAAGDTVIMRNGTYTEDLLLQKDGITIQADTGHTPTFDGGWHPGLISGGYMPAPSAGMYPNPPSRYRGMFRIEASNITIDGIKIVNAAGGGITMGPGAATGTTLRNLFIDFTMGASITVNPGGAFGSSWCDDVLIEDCVFSRSGWIIRAPTAPEYNGYWPGCMNITKARDSTIRNCIIAYSQGEGINLHHGTLRTTVENCVLHDNKGINLYINASVECIFRNNFVYQSSTPAPYVGTGLSGIAESDETHAIYTLGVSRSRNNQIYNNIVVNCKQGFRILSNQTGYLNSYLDRSYIGFNTIVSGPRTEYAVLVAPAQTGYPHRNSIFENNIILRNGTAAVIASGNPTGITFRNNIWDTTPPAAFQGTASSVGNANLVSPTTLADDTHPDPSGNGNPDNYKLTVGSTLAINSASNGSATNGLTPPTLPRQEDHFGAVRNTPDIGAHEYATTGDAPTAPTNVSATATSPTSILVEWDEVDEALSYHVQWSNNGVNWQAGWSGIQTAYYLDDAMQPETTRYYRVRASNQYGQSAFSSGVSATTPAEEEPPPVGTGEYEGEIEASSDNAMQAGNGAVTVGPEVLASGGGQTWLAFRFNDVNVPQGTIPTSAAIRLYFMASRLPNHDIYAADMDDTAAFTGTTNEISGLARTTEKVEWTAGPLPGGLNDSPDLSDVLAEVFARGGWALNNSLTIIFDSLGGGGINAAGFDHATNPGAKLIIEWEGGESHIGLGELQVADVTIAATGRIDVGPAATADGVLPLEGAIIAAYGEVRDTPLPTVPDVAWVNGLYTEIIVADHRGRPIGELSGELESVAWKLNETGQARLTLPVPGTAAELLAIGNRVRIEFDNGLPRWTGFLDPPRRWETGRVRLTQYSGHRLLSHRTTGRDRRFTSTSAGAIMAALLGEQDAPSVVLPGAIWQGGRLLDQEYHLESLHDVLDDLSATSGIDYDIVGEIESGKLIFRLNLYERRGRYLPNIFLLEGRNIAVDGLEEQGPIVNEWKLAGGGTGWGEDAGPYSTARDANSAVAFGLRQAAEVVNDTTDAATLDERAATNLAATRDLYAAVSLMALNLPPGRFGDYDVGDTVNVELYSIPAPGGFRGTRRLVGREFRPRSAGCEVLLI